MAKKKQVRKSTSKYGGKGYVPTGLAFLAAFFLIWGIFEAMNVKGSVFLGLGAGFLAMLILRLKYMKQN